MEQVTVTIDGILLYCDESILNVNIGNGYKLEKRYLSDIPYKNKVTDGDGKLTIDYLGSKLEDDGGVYFICIHKDDVYEINEPRLQAGVRLTERDFMCEGQLVEYKQRETDYLYKQFSLLKLYKPGNVGYVQLFLNHSFSVLNGFIKSTMRQTEENVTRNTINNMFFSLSSAEVIGCNQFLSDVNNHVYQMLKKCIDEFVWATEQIDVPTGFEQFTTALEMVLLSNGQQGKKEVLSKRTAVLLENDPYKISQVYDTMKRFYRFRSESLHEGNGNNITVNELKELEDIVRKVIRQYLIFCESAISNDPSVTWENIKANIITELIAKVESARNAGVPI